MHDDDPIYDPVRQIAQATAGIYANLQRLTVLTEQTREVSTEVLKTQRTVLYSLWINSLVVVLIVAMLGWLIWQSLTFSAHNALLHTQTQQMIQQQQQSINEVLRRVP